MMEAEIEKEREWSSIEKNRRETQRRRETLRSIDFYSRNDRPKAPVLPNCLTKDNAPFKFYFTTYTTS